MNSILLNVREEEEEEEEEEMYNNIKHGKVAISDIGDPGPIQCIYTDESTWLETWEPTTDTETFLMQEATKFNLACFCFSTVILCTSVIHTTLFRMAGAGLYSSMHWARIQVQHGKVTSPSQV